MTDIRIFGPGACPPDLYRFSYAVYVEEMGRKQKYARHDERTIIDPLDDTGVNVVAFENDAIVGCVRVNFLEDGPIGEYEAFFEIAGLDGAERSKASITTRLMVGPSKRRTSVTLEIITRVYEYALGRGNLTSYIDCNDHLVRFFLKFGYRQMFEKPHPEYGDVTVMRIDVRDLKHLVAVGSPFAPICRRFLSEQRKARAPALLPA